VTPERWRHINDLFHATLERPPAARDRFLETAAGADLDLAREVRSLLASHNASSEFLEKPAYAVAADLILNDDQSLMGRQIGVYRVLEEIGRGGMGIVYAAQDTRLGRKVALKALPPEFSNDPVRRERLRREAVAAAHLSHPAVATIFELLEYEGDLFLISELVRGRTLREELRAGPLPPARLLETLVDIASGLAAAHAENITHRDLKPENIIRCGDGRVKILDFGLAKIAGGSAEAPTVHNTQVNMAVGTPGYMSPEQRRGEPVDVRTDIFAFGILGWELATGRPPMGADFLPDLTETALPVPGLGEILRRCLRASPEGRYDSGESLLREIRGLHRAVESGSAPAARPSQGLWWWQFHQATVAIVNGLTPVCGWFVRQWAEHRPYGAVAFFLLLALATVSVTLRLNLLFISRVHPSTLPRHRARFFTYIAVVEAVLAMVLLGSAALVVGPHDALAAILITLAVVTFASLGIIEPATTSAAGLDTDGRS
jgi:hypothetical protein